MDQDLSASDTFGKAAAMASPRRAVTVEIEADLLDRLAARQENAADEINGLLRFYLDTTDAKEAEFAPTAWEPGEMAPHSVPDFA